MKAILVACLLGASAILATVLAPAGRGVAAEVPLPAAGVVTSVAAAGTGAASAVPATAVRVWVRPVVVATPTTVRPKQPAPPTTRPSPPTTVATPTDPPGLIVTHWAQLYLNGAPYRFLSIANPAAATDWGVNFGCGGMATDGQLDAFFAALPPHTLVPFWASQAMAFNDRTTHAIDFTAIDRVFAAVARHGDCVLPELEHEQGDCSDGHLKDLSWYAGGYRTAFDTDGRGLEPLSYWQYLQLIIPRYRNNPALGMWGLVVEPEAPTCNAGSGADCPSRNHCDEGAAARALRSFFDTVGGEVKALDPRHLITSGTIGGGQCGWVGTDFATVNASPAIGVCEVHDYNWANTPINTEAKQDINTCKALGKPLIVGETGLSASPTSQPGCAQTVAERAGSFRTRIADYMGAGASGLALWDWAIAAPPGCSYYIAGNDPVVSVIDQYPV